MKRDKESKLLAIIAIIIAVTGLSIAYASLSSTLKFSAAFPIKSSTWGVLFDNGSLSTPSTSNGGITGYASITSTPTITATQISGNNLGFTKPGDSVTYTFNVMNKGTIDAKIISFNYLVPSYNAVSTGEQASIDTNLVKSNLNLKLVYNISTTKIQTGDAIIINSEVAENQILKAGQTVSLKLTIAYDMTKVSKEIPSGTVTINNYGATIIYGQA